MGKDYPVDAGHTRGVGPIAGSGRSPGAGNGNPLARKIIRTAESGGLQCMGSQRIGKDCATEHTNTQCHNKG